MGDLLRGLGNAEPRDGVTERVRRQWRHCGVTGVTVASLWPQCGVTVASLWPHCGLNVASLWPQCGVIVASMWRHCGLTVATPSGGGVISQHELPFEPWLKTRARCGRQSLVGTDSTSMVDVSMAAMTTCVTAIVHICCVAAATRSHTHNRHVFQNSRRLADPPLPLAASATLATGPFRPLLHLSLDCTCLNHLWPHSTAGRSSGYTALFTRAHPLSPPRAQEGTGSPEDVPGSFYCEVQKLAAPGGPFFSVARSRPLFEQPTAKVGVCTKGQALHGAALLRRRA
eukprot:351311-Chlamydomonas_euryale.AAC.3